MASERVQRQIDRLLDEAEEAVVRHQWDVVRARAESVLAYDPDNADAAAFIAVADRTNTTTAPPPLSAIELPTTRTAQPSSFANGRYQVKEFLGEGGKKRVYLAQDTLLDREVAFALIKAEGPYSRRGLNHIFISHVHEDSSLAIELADALEAKGYSTWYYERDSLPGPAYLAQMGEAIEQADAVVLLISESSVGSNQVTTEVVRAHESNKAFVPLLYGISHEEFQQRAPVWRQALGASTAIGLREGEVGEVVGRVIDGLEALGIRGGLGMSGEERSRVSREAQSMGRLSSHPHIVTVFDLGDHDGQPYMVTEYMAGGDVEGLIEEAPDHRLPLEQTLRIAMETCRGLEFAHSRGIVHRDLKPGNVWLGEDGTAKIGDFGLAIATDRSRLTQEGMMVGTLSYMPPEQALGGKVTPQADLYSLGAMLYEMVCGRPPFLGDDSVAIIGQHINTPPVAPTWHNPSCPRAMEALIMRLLAKDPSERPNSAADVLTALQSIDLSTPAQTPGTDDAEANALDSLAGGVFVGRQTEMNQLKAALEDTLSGRGKLVTLVGEPGIGKTRTSEELATYAGLRGAQVLWGRCYEGGGAPPYWPWVQAIRSYVREQEPDELRRQMGSGAAVIAEVIADVKDRLPELVPPPQLDDADSARFRLFDSITSFLKTASQSQPLVIVLDDLHWSDRPSLTLLEFIARELQHSRLLLVGTYRDVELNRRHQLTVTLGDLARDRLYDRVLLRGLTEEDIARFIEIAAGFVAPRELAATVHRHTEGNPLFVTEVVRDLVQSGELTEEKVSGRSSWSLRIPEGVKEVIGRRLDRLSDRTNETLTIASVVGREFSFAALRALAEDTSESQLLDVIDESLSARLIEELPDAVGDYRFTHAVVQETLAGEMSATRTVRVHARVAEALEGLYGDDADAYAEELVPHFVEAETVLGTERVIHYATVAGRRALEAVAPSSAEDYFQTGVDAFGNQPPDARLAEMLGGLGRAQVSTLGRYLQTAIDNLTRSFQIHLELGQPAAAVRVAMTSMPSVHGPTGMADLLERALPLAEEGSQEQGRLLAEFGMWLSHERADYTAAVDAFERALAIAEREEDLSLELRVHTRAAPVHAWNLRYEEAFKSSQAAIRLAEKLDDPGSGVEAHFHAGRYYLGMGDLSSARSHAEACLTLAERAKNVFHWTSAMSVNAAIANAVGDWEAAREFIGQGLARDPTERRLLFSLIGLEFRVGDFDRALELLEGQVSESDFFVAAQAFGALLGAPITITSELEQEAREILSSESLEPFAKHTALMAVGLIAVAQRDEALAREVYENPLISTEVEAFFRIRWLVGAIAWNAGLGDAAATHFEEVIAFSRNAGFKPELAEACAFYAEMLMEREAPGDREKATELLEESLTISTELGMRPLVDRVRSRRETLRA